MLSPLSGTMDCTLLKDLDVQSVTRRWREELGIIWNPPPDIDRIQYWRDDSTGLHFYTPEAVAGEAGLYQQLQVFPWYYMQDKWEFSRALSLLAEHLDESSVKVIEVGVGKGFFLERARDAGIAVTGIELNPDAAVAARGLGFDVYEQSLEHLVEESSNQWDAICSFQVLEHVTKPGHFIENSLRLLKPRGWLILSVPNAAVSRALDPERTTLLDQPPHHMSHWDEGVFRSLENLFPVRLSSIDFEPLAAYHVDWFVGSWRARLQSRLGRPVGRLLLNRFTFPLVQRSLKLGLRNFVRGHTMIVCIQKLG